MAWGSNSRSSSHSSFRSSPFTDFGRYFLAFKPIQSCCFFFFNSHMCDLFHWLVVTILEDRRGGERIGRGWKRWEDIGPCLRGEEDARRFEDIF
ncbi:hypothetical protein HanRHA438_Chr10g0439871 [Helianthus annuus]|nr:hypothetical protein HanOQP8_Chr10g0355481 [Helianthus annuus]KAJ0878444.1 hypothetical protein HanRHA438_Chr10g0439871 [Helianthus annuus]